MQVIKGFNYHKETMNNRNFFKQYPEKINMKSSAMYNPSIEVLPNLYKAGQFPSSLNMSGSNKSSQNSTDDNDFYSRRIKEIVPNNKSKSVYNLFKSDSDDDCRNVTLQLEGTKKSLKFAIESMVGGEKLQMNSELLLLSSSNDLWPLSLHHLNKVNRDFSRFVDCYDELTDSLKQFGNIIDAFERTIIGCDNSKAPVEVKITCLTDMLNTAITVMELTYQTVYSISSTQPLWKQSQTGLLDRKTIISAIDDVELCCFRLREVLLRSTNSDDHSQKDPELSDVMLLSCSQFSSSLTYLAMCCRTASASVDMSIKSFNKNHRSSINNRPEENLFHLAMKSVSKSSQCMLASVKNFVQEPNPENKFITESFTKSVSSSVKSLAAMATSRKFVGYPSALPINIKMTRNTICGSCVSIISPTIQLLQTVATLYSPNSIVRPGGTSNIDNLCQRAITCIAAMRDALLHFQHTLNLYQNY